MKAVGARLEALGRAAFAARPTMLCGDAAMVSLSPRASFWPTADSLQPRASRSGGAP
jgi:hypothetical protein